MKSDLIRTRLEGLETRIQQRRNRRRLKQAEYIERKRIGRVREYEAMKWKRA